MNLKKRLLSNLYPVGIAFVLLLVVASLLIVSINNSAQEIIFESDPPIRVIEYFLLNIVNDNIVLASYLQTTSYQETVDHDRRLYSSFQHDLQVKREIEDLIAARNVSNQRIIEYYNEAKTVHDDVIIKRNEIVTLHKESLLAEVNHSREKQTLLIQHKEQFESARNRLSQIIEQINLDNEQIQREIVDDIQFYSILLLVILCSFLVVIISRILAFSNEIVDPLQAIMDKTKRFTKGDFKVRASSKTKISEIRDLEKNINNVFKAVEENVSKKSGGANHSNLLKKEYHEILNLVQKNNDEHKQTTITDLKNALNVTHPTILSRLTFLELNGYIKIVKIGREKTILLTKKK